MAEHVQLGIQEARYGEVIAGELSPADQVVLTVMIDGVSRTTLALSPEDALRAADAITRAASRLIAGRIDDTGKRAGLAGYFKAAGTLHRTKDA